MNPHGRSAIIAGGGGGARDLAPLGVRVCAIAPGAMATPRLTSPAVIDTLVQDMAFPKRPGRPEEFAGIVEMIVRTPFLNGEVIRLDGAARLSSELPRPKAWT